MNNKILTKHYASPCGKILLGSFKDKAFEPCHRVIGSDHTLTGNGGGLEAKKYLLELEQRQSR